MSAQTDLTILENDIRTAGLELPASIQKTLDHHRQVRVDIAALGNVNSADPRLVATTALAALDAGRDPAVDKTTRTALARWLLGSNFGSRLDEAAAQAAITAIREQDTEFIQSLDQMFLQVVDELRRAHEVLSPFGVETGLRDPLGQLANMGGAAVTARLAWTDALTKLKPIRRMYSAVVGHAPNRTDYGDVRDQLREDVLADPGWWQAREDMASLFWGLLDTPSWTPGLANRDESIQRASDLEAERPKPSAAEVKAARHVTMINLGEVA